MVKIRHKAAANCHLIMASWFIVKPSGMLFMYRAKYGQSVTNLDHQVLLSYALSFICPEHCLSVMKIYVCDIGKAFDSVAL